MNLELDFSTPPARAHRDDPVRYALIPGWPDYRAGTDGSVWTSKLRANGGWRRMLTPLNTGGYPKVTLSQNNIQKDFVVHHLILLTFAGPKPDGASLCRHLDGDPTNNYLSNLKWGTSKENEADKARHGRTLRGEAVFGARLNADSVRKMRELFASGISAYRLARDFGVDNSTANRVVKRRTWAHI